MTTESLIPTDISTRNNLRSEATRFMQSKGLTPPLSVEQLRSLSCEFIELNQLDKSLEDWIVVHLNNALWRDIVASIPPERRILLLPQCLRNSRSCKASFDEWGLLCAGCKACSISSIQEEADELGMITIVSEGYSGVQKLLQSGEAEAVIGVACLESLEKSYPHLIGKAVAAVAIPLNESNCIDTTFDQSIAREFLYMTSPSTHQSIDFEGLHNEVKQLFTPPLLSEIAGIPQSESLRIAHEYVCQSGNRWRPFLSVAVHSALTQSPFLSPELIRLAVAIEFFHKASLVHDDIEDNDSLRDGFPTLHTTYGIPMAVNIGDILLAEGYRLLAECNQIEILKLATRAVVALAVGQGRELEWNRKPRLLTVDESIEMSRCKTAPAFSIAIELGALFANASTEIVEQLRLFADALGIAYQLKDDLKDTLTQSLSTDTIYASLCDQDPILAQQLLNNYTQQAYDALLPLHHLELKRLFFRVIEKVLGK